MERQSRITRAGILAAMLAIMFLAGCTTKEEKQAANEYQGQESYDTKANGSDQGSQENASDKDRKNETEEESQETEEMKNLRITMEKAMEAIESDDAKALNKLQKSKKGKALIREAEKEGSYLYLPKGGNTGTGIGLYVFENCDCKQWYYGDYQNGRRQGSGKWYYVSDQTEDGSLYKEVYDGDWSGDMPNGKGRQLIILGDHVDTDQKFKVKNGLFYGTYKVEDTLEDGTVVAGEYKLKKGKYVTISDEELEANNFAVPEEPHLAIAFLYNEAGEVKSCTMVYAEDATKGVKHFY